MAYINLGQVMYPVGAIYQSWSATSPASLFGGSWSQITEKFLYCSNSAGGTGGASTVTLNVNQMPTHTHDAKVSQPNSISHDIFADCISDLGYVWSKQFTGRDEFTNAELNAQLPNKGSLVTARGGGQSHENMPPYIKCYTWRRHA